MSVLDLATATRTGRGFATFSPVDAYAEYADTDGYTRVIALRDSDSAPHVIFAREGADLVATHNERSRITHERSLALKTLDESEDADETAALSESVARLDLALETLAKTRAVPTLHVARALAHYSDAE